MEHLARLHKIQMNLTNKKKSLNRQGNAEKSNATTYFANKSLEKIHHNFSSVSIKAQF